MPDWLYECGPRGLWIFVLLTVLLGGAAAWATGRAIATTWRPVWQVPVYGLLLTLAVRFLHFALFEEPLLAPGNAIVSGVVLLTAAALGYRLARAGAMITQYGWLYEQAGALGWKPRGRGEVGGNSVAARDSG